MMLLGVFLISFILSSYTGNVNAFTIPKNAHHSLTGNIQRQISAFSKTNYDESLFSSSFSTSTITYSRASTSRYSVALDSESNSKNSKPKSSYDVIVVGSGIGGLTTAAMLSYYNYSVAVLESHYLVGGCAHGFTTTQKIDDEKCEFRFDTGPSFFSGLNPNIPAKSSNPLRTVLDIIGEEVECIPYTSFGLCFPEGDFIHTPNFGKDGGVLDQLQSQKNGQSHPNNLEAKQEWERLLENMKPLAKAVDAMPTAALRADLGALLTTASFLPNFAKLNPLDTMKLTTPFQSILNQSSLKTPFLQNWMDLLCFCLSGLPASGTITAEMAMMMGEFYDASAVMDCPKGGANAIVDALVRGIIKQGGEVFTKSHVEEIMIENGKAVGIRLKKDPTNVIKANKAVVSNLSVWDMFSKKQSDTPILDPKHFPSKFLEERSITPMGKSFMHLHIGFRATLEELSKLQAHYIYIKDWERGIETEDNVALLSIPSVHDQTLAPEGYAVLHIYTPATEDYAKWEPFKHDRSSQKYQSLKKERSQFLFNVLDEIFPDDFNLQDRIVTCEIGTPLTHERFLRRYKGSYGPAIQAGVGSFPFPSTPIENLLLCGDSCFPGIGVPAVAGSGLLAAHSVSFDSIGGQLKVLEKLKESV